MAVHAKTFNVDLYELGVTSNPPNALVEFTRDQNESQRLTISSRSERWTFELADSRTRELDPDSIRLDGRPISSSAIPSWLAFVLEYIDCTLPAEHRDRRVRGSA